MTSWYHLGDIISSRCLWSRCTKNRENERHQQRTKMNETGEREQRDDERLGLAPVTVPLSTHRPFALAGHCPIMQYAISRRHWDSDLWSWRTEHAKFHLQSEMISHVKTRLDLNSHMRLPHNAINCLSHMQPCLVIALTNSVHGSDQAVRWFLVCETASIKSHFCMTCVPTHA